MKIKLKDLTKNNIYFAGYGRVEFNDKGIAEVPNSMKAQVSMSTLVEVIEETENKSNKAKSREEAPKDNEVSTNEEETK